MLINGYFPNSAKVFPGEVIFPGLEYEDELEDNQSPKFLEAAKNVTDEVSDHFSPLFMCFFYFYFL